MAQPGIFLLKILEAFGLIRSEAAIFLALPVIALLRHAKASADLADRFPLRQRHLGLTQQIDDLFGFASAAHSFLLQ